jgi:FIMAH domain
MIEGFIKDGLLPPDQGHDLLVNWDLVIKQVEKGNIRPAENQLEKFIAQVNELVKSGLLPAAQGKTLLDRANEVLDQLKQFDSPKKNLK